MLRPLRIVPTASRSSNVKPPKVSISNLILSNPIMPRFFMTASPASARSLPLEHPVRYGDALLHQLVSNFENMETYRRGIADVPKETLVKLSLTTNNQGKIPFDLLPKDAQQELRASLYELILGIINDLIEQVVHKFLVVVQ